MAILSRQEQDGNIEQKSRQGLLILKNRTE